VLTALGRRDDLGSFGQTASRVERDQLREQRRELDVVDALHERVTLYDAGHTIV